MPQQPNNPLNTEGTGVVLLRKILDERYFPQLDFYLSQASFADGSSTASGGAKTVKHNLQIEAQDQIVLPQVQQLIAHALMEFPLFHAIAFPAKLYPFIISRYEVGMGYGWHTDSPLMGSPPVRTDLAMTLFLSEPDSYEGGELVIQDSQGTTSYKPQRGDAILYPCQYVHCVNEVKSGVRVAAVTWIQSMLRSQEQRQILFQLKQLHEALAQNNPHAPEAVQLIQTWSNLLRMWVEI